MQRLGVVLFLVFAIGRPVAAWGEQLVYFTESPRGLYNFDTNTGISALRAAMTGTERFFAMDTQASDGKVFAVDLLGHGLWTVNIDSGQTSLVGTITPAIDRPEGIAFDPRNGDLYVDSLLGSLYRIDPSSAGSTFVGDSGLTINGHSFSPDGSTLVAFRQGSGAAYMVNPGSAAATLIGASVPSTVPEDSTFTASGLLFVTDYHGAIYRVNPATGAATFVATTGHGDGLLGLTSVPEPCSTGWLMVWMFAIFERMRPRAVSLRN